MAKALEFYKNVLGFAVSHESATWCEISLGITIALKQIDAQSCSTSSCSSTKTNNNIQSTIETSHRTGIVFNVVNATKSYETMKNLGIKIVGDPGPGLQRGEPQVQLRGSVRQPLLGLRQQVVRVETQARGRARKGSPFAFLGSLFPCESSSRSSSSPSLRRRAPRTSPRSRTLGRSSSDRSSLTARAGSSSGSRACRRSHATRRPPWWASSGSRSSWSSCAGMSPRPRYGPAEFSDLLFAKGRSKGPDGEPVLGSVRDFYAEQSGGALEIAGKVFDWVKVGAKRAELEGSNFLDLGARRSTLLAALDGVLRRDGERILDGFDGLTFVVSGGFAKKRGSLLWPHSFSLLHRGRVWRYYLMHARRRPAHGADRHPCSPSSATSSAFRNKYRLAPHAGAGVFCLMAIGNYGGETGWVPLEAPPSRSTRRSRRRSRTSSASSATPSGSGRRPSPRRCPDDDAYYCAAPPPGAAGGGARPTHACAPCKLALGWAKATVVDPGSRQRLRLDPVEADPSNVLVLPLNGCGEERLVLLEYRGRKGYDAHLPRSGLLAWRTGLQARAHSPRPRRQRRARPGARDQDDRRRVPWARRGHVPVARSDRAPRRQGARERDAARGRVSLPRVGD